MGVDPNERLDPREYNLAAGQLEYLLTGELPKTYSNDEDLVDGIEKAVQEINTRLRYLVEDLSVLHQREYLNPERRREIHDSYQIDHTNWYWTLLDPQQSEEEAEFSSSRLINRSDTLYNPPVGVREVPRSSYRLIKLGVHLGHILYFLKQNAEIEFRQPELISGFMMGLGGRWLDDVQGVDNIPTWVKQLNGPIDDILEDIDEAQSSLLDAIDAKTEEVGLHDRIQQRLEDADLEPVPPLVVAVYNQVAPRLIEEYESSQLIIVDELDDTEVIDYIWSAITDVKTDQRVQQAQELADRIEDDISILKNKQWRSDWRELDILAGFWLNKSNTSSVNPASTKAVINKGQSQISRTEVGYHLNNLAGDGKSPEPWDNYPLVKEQHGDRELTDYGELLGLLVTRRGKEDIQYPPKKNIGQSARIPVLSPDEEELVREPTREELLSACYACSLGQVRERSDVVEDAYNDRVA